jgi:paraquat-inducible protein B
MTDTPDANKPELADIPEAVSEPKRRFSVQLVWIIPIVAAIIGLSLAVKSYMERGQTITITFKTGEGMEAGKTKIKYKDVQIGEVTALAISKDRSHVVVTAEIYKEAKRLLVQDTRFWVVRARISGGSVTGLGTLLAGSYIGVDAGTSTEPRTRFSGLDTPPVVAMDVPGRQFVLRTAEVGSLDTSSPVFYRRIQVGQVIATQLDPDGKGVTVRIFIRSPYDKYVKTTTFFWHASGIDLSLSPSGVKISTESVVSILLGGISFQEPDDALTEAPAVPAGTVFPLFVTKDEAMKHVEAVETFELVFRESVRGLSLGAPVDLRGVTVGEVSKIDVALNDQRSDVSIPVEIQFYPERLHRQLTRKSAQAKAQNTRELINSLVAHGLRAQIKSGSLLTGQLYIGLDFVPKARPAKINWSSTPPEFPTITGSMEQVQKSLMQIVQKFEKLPLEELAGDAGKTLRSLDTTLVSADKLIRNMDGSLIPEARSVLGEAKRSLEDVRKTLDETRKTLSGASEVLSADAPVQTDLRDTLKEVSRAAQSLRVLGDYLEQHPESLIRGKKEEKR